MTSRTEPVAFAVIQFLFWSSIVTFEAFMVPYLRENGYTPGAIGPIMGAVFGLAVVGQPLLGALADRISSPKLLIAGALAVASLAVLATPAVVSWYPAVVLIALVYSLSANSLPAVFDGWIMARREHNPRISYGVSRGFGSAGFAAGAAAVGFVAERFGSAVIFPIYVAVALSSAALVLRVPRAGESQGSTVSAGTAAAGIASAGIAAGDEFGGDRQGRRNGRRILAAIRENGAAVLGNRPYLTLLLGSLLAFVGFRAALTFLPLLIEELGGSVSDVGLAHSVGAVSEIPFLFFSSWLLYRYRGPALITLILALLSLRLFVYTLLGDTTQLLILQLSHGLTFGLFLAATVDWIHRIAPKQHRSFFQALAPSIYFGIGSISGSWLGGVVIETFSVMTMYRLAALFAAAGAVVIAFGGSRGLRDDFARRV